MVETVIDKVGKNVPQYIWVTRRGKQIQVVNANYTRLVNLKAEAMRASESVILEVHMCVSEC